MRSGLIASMMLATGLVAYAAASVPAEPTSGVADPARWPTVTHDRAPDPEIERRIDDLLRQMSVEDKAAQLLMVNISYVTLDDLRHVRIGAILNGGDDSPGRVKIASPEAWLKAADEYWDASTAPEHGTVIPEIWGIDAVHGDAKIIGATIFPHNIGLGAARDPALIGRIGAATAEETAAIGLDWTFGPTIAVSRDVRWGRTYESYSEDPTVVAAYAGAMVEGVQGRPGTPDFMSPAHVIATAKHFLGDGGTGGHDQGDTVASEEALRDVHAPGYEAAVRAGVLSIMASYSSWNGVKMHGNQSLLTGVLKDRWGFDGLVVGDYKGHMRVPGCAVDHCPETIDAGLDMFMTAENWRELLRNTIEDVKSGRIPEARLDDAVRRILRVKFLAHAIDRGRPSTRPLAGHFDLLGSPAHRALARQAARESLVLLKNEDALPLRPRANVLVSGAGADSLPRQCGGWTLTWQGTATTNQDFPHAQSIWSGIEQAVRAGGGHATLSPDGSFDAKPDVAIVVFGETPYAEFLGDKPTLEYSPEDKADLALLKRLKAAGIPVVSVFLSGRPLWVNAELNASDAFVAAFLPGGEGGAVADLLFRAEDGTMPYDFKGKLSFSWPKRSDQFVLNASTKPYDPLFAFGYGLTYAAPGHVPTLDESRPAGLPVATGPLFGRGKVPDGWAMEVADFNTPATKLVGGEGSEDNIRAVPVDRRVQEDARRVTWTDRPNDRSNVGGELRIVPPAPLDLTRETGGELALVVEYRVEQAPKAAELVVVGASGERAAVPVGAALREAPKDEWRALAVPLKCFAARGVDPARIAIPFVLSTKDPMTIEISDVRIESSPTPVDHCGGA